jgi:preprotein translocase subunit SecY
MNRLKQLFTVPEIRNKVLIVLGLLAVYRVLAAIPIPGVDPARLSNFFNSNQILGFLNFFSGGGLSHLSVVMLGLGPYITATIIMQLMTIIFPRMKELYYEEGARGQAKFNQYCRLLTVPLALLQGYFFLAILERANVIARPDLFPLIVNLLVITAGSMIALWLGELITEQKIGNGVSLIIFAGIVARLPNDVTLAWGTYSPDVLVAYLILILLIVLGVVYLNEGERRIPVTYARQVRGNKVYGGASSYLPLKVNQAGMIPLIFAIAILYFPQFVGQVFQRFYTGLGTRVNDFITAFYNAHLWYGLVYFFLVFAFTYFYTAITFNPEEISKNLQRGGGFIPGIRPGEATEHAFGRILNRITLFGAVSLGLIAVLPLIVQGVLVATGSISAAGTSNLGLSGTAIIIVVAVALEIMRQVNSQLDVREYER